MQRRDFFQRAVATVGTVAGTVAGATVAISAVSRSALAGLPEPVIQTRPDTAAPSTTRTPGH